MIRVHVSSSSAIMRAGLEAWLRASTDIEIAPDAHSADVLLAEVDGDDPPQQLLETTGPALVLLTGEHQPPWTAEALRAGARAVLPRDLSPPEILAAVQAAAAGLIVLHPQDLDVLAPARPTVAQPALLEPLSGREMEVLGMMAEGLSNKEIAGRLGISDHTVKFHVGSIMAKLQASSRTEAVTQGLRLGLILL